MFARGSFSLDNRHFIAGLCVCVAWDMNENYYVSTANADINFYSKSVETKMI